MGILTKGTTNKLEKIVPQPHKNLICPNLKSRVQFWCLHLKKGIAELEKGNINEDDGTTVLLDVHQIGTMSFGRKTPWEEHDLSLQKEKSSGKVKELLL